MIYIIRNKITKRVVVRTDSYFNMTVWYKKILPKENYELIVIRKKKGAK